MNLRKRLGLRLHRAFLYWGLMEHPRGRDYAKERYTPLGGERDSGKQEADFPDENGGSEE